MGRASIKENKTLYQIAREELGLSREKASELLESITPERIEKIENERSLPYADEVLIMADKYKNKVPKKVYDALLRYEVKPYVED